ncbi:MAG TPA: zinc ribbon domain-containing protein [Blastocatellia bacterium]|nr:zinc ribbon domain-containing protein [Blastocatellia bacterium]
MSKFTILEPMSTGDVIDRAVRLYRRNFTSLVAIVAVPTLIGYISSLMFWYGYANLFVPTATASAAPDDAVWMLIVGGLGFPVWLFSLLVTVAGLSRVIGDYVMMGEPITFRKCFATVRRKMGDITLMGLLALVIAFGIYVALVMVVLLFVIIIGLIGGVVVVAHLPQWGVTLIMSFVILIAVAVALAVVSFIFARVVFLPQVVMIEGQSAGAAIGRAVRLGKGNWYRVGSIVLFTYFVSLSLMWALLLPVLATLYLTGMVGPGFYSSSTWNVFYTSFKDVSSLLSLPIWIVSFTLLYFDSRVRKEAYDVELLAREVAPGFYWQPAPVAQPAFAGHTQNRAYVQTSPLGLGGPIPRAPVAPAGSVCERCGGRLEEKARFCSYCGKAVEQASDSQVAEEIR